jgi:hypothetical protein
MVALPRGCASVVHGSFASDVYFAEAKNMIAWRGSRVLKETALDPLSGKTPADFKLNAARIGRICSGIVKI